MQKLLLIALTTLVVSCGGGGFAKTPAVVETLPAELVEKYNLPPQPVYPNGVKVDPRNIIDVNNNDIEDGWERLIVEKSHGDETRVNLYMARAKSDTILTKGYISGDTSQYAEAFEEWRLSSSCDAYLYEDNDDSITGEYLYLNEDSSRNRDYYDFTVKRDSNIYKTLGIGGIDFGINPSECDKYLVE